MLKFYESTDMTNIANAIRSKNGSSSTYKVSQMAAAIEAIPDKMRNNLEGTITELVSDALSVRSYAFYNYATITSATLPKATTIGERSFGGCSNLTAVVLGAVQSITYNAFAYAGVTDLVLDVSAIPTLASTSAFSNTPIASGTGTIWITDSLVDTLKAATNWSTYASQIRKLSERSES